MELHLPLDIIKLKVAIHQPQYLPYPGFFHKVGLADTFVVMDDVQYDKRFTNRNKIICPNGWLWLSVPINKKQKFERNMDVEINNNLTWRILHLRKLQLSYNRSKFFHLYKHFFENLYSKDWTFLFDLNFETLKQIIHWLGLKVEIIRESELCVTSNSTQRLVDVCKAVGANTYVAGRGSTSYMNEQIFRGNNLRIVYQQYNPVRYSQNLSTEFIPDLSIVDMLANIGPDSSKLLMQNEPLSETEIQDSLIAPKIS